MAQLMNVLKEDFNDLLVLDNALKHWMCEWTKIF
jgi:hypothetical protein